MTDIIAAKATGNAVGGISIIRVSGEGSICKINSLFKGENLNCVDSHTINYGKIIDGKREVDEVLVSVMKAPKTFTGEDVVEINCHGGLLITNNILEQVLNIDGIRMAEPGEFSKRAFMNGKKSLIATKAINDIINATNDTAIQMATTSFEERSSSNIEGIRSALMDIIANIEVNIDYPEYEDIEEFTNNYLHNKILLLSQEIDKTIIYSKQGSIYNSGLTTAIIGSPNVGKSTLLNALTKEERAIVTDIEGTTTDSIEATVNLSTLTLNLVDTAGIRETTNLIEKLGVDKSKEWILKSDLVLFIVDGSRQLTKEEKDLYLSIKNENVIVIINKVDLQDLDFTDFFEDYIKISAFNGDNLEMIETKIIEIFNLATFDVNSGKYLTDLSDLLKLKEAKIHLEEAIKNIALGVPIDIIEVDLKEAMFKLGEILGIEVKSDLLNELFSRFCLGK